MWSLDWFAASAKARQEKLPIRRAGWTDRWLVLRRGVWFIVTATTSTVAKRSDYDERDLYARDWTTEPFNADPCAATPAFNTTPPTYGSWSNEPIFLPPPVPGFPMPT